MKGMNNGIKVNRTENQRMLDFAMLQKSMSSCLDPYRAAAAWNPPGRFPKGTLRRRSYLPTSVQHRIRAYAFTTLVASDIHPI
jgi:hypothetical protein